MEQNLTSPTVQTAAGAPSETARMRSAYNRGGLGLAALYGVMQALASVVLAFGMIAIVVIRLLPQLESMKPWHSLEDLAGFLELLKSGGTMGWILIIYVLGMVLGMIGGILIMRLICKKEGSIEKRPLSLGGFLKIVLIAYGLWGIGIVLGNFPSFFGTEEQSMLEQVLEGLKWEAVPMYLYMVIGAPFFEELACRKILLDRLHPYGEGFAVAASGLLFGLLHGNSGQFFLAFLLGSLFAVVYLRTGRVIYTMILHGIINLTATIPEFAKLFGADFSEVWNTYVIGALAVAGFIALLICRNDPVLHPERSSVPDAASGAWKNVGMILCRVRGIVLIVSYDVTMMVLSIIAERSMLPLLTLIPVSLAVALILLLPGWTKRYEAKEKEEKEQQEEVSLGQSCL